MNELELWTDRMRLLGDGTRLRILALLSREELSVGELAAVLGQRQSTISTHLAKLKDAGLVQDRRSGTRSFYRIPDGGIDGPAERLWALAAERLAGDPVFEADGRRLTEVIQARRAGGWLDRAAGSLDRRWVPGRSWSVVALGLGRLLDLGVCIDMGSGDGALLPFLAPAAKRLVCIDAHPQMVAAGRRRARAEGWRHVRFVEGDMHEPPYRGRPADTVLWLQSLQYAADPPQALAAGASLLGRGGRAVVLTLRSHRDRALREEYGHLWSGFAPRRLADWLRNAGLQRVRVESLGHDPKAPQLEILFATGVRGNR